MRKVAIFMIIMICLGLSVPAYATRRRYIEKQANEEEAVVGTSIDYRNHMYVDGLPGPSAFNPKDLEGYTYDGIPIKVPNFGNHKEYEVDQIKNFSDAIIDFLGWDAMLGVADYDLEENKLMFEPIKGVDSNANNTIGYGRRKFGEEPIEFKARIVDESSSDSTFSNWVGISFRTTTTQAPQWRDNPGYLFVIKSDVIELQRWLPDQKML